MGKNPFTGESPDSSGRVKYYNLGLGADILSSWLISIANPNSNSTYVSFGSCANIGSGVLQKAVGHGCGADKPSTDAPASGHGYTALTFSPSAS